ncbi:unnamed protein product, partial [Symbiodinium sp. KB8]
PLGPPKTVATVAARPGFEPQYVQNLKTKDILIAELRQEILQKEVTIEGLLKVLAKGAPAAKGEAAAAVVPARVKEVLVKKAGCCERLQGICQLSDSDRRFAKTSLWSPCLTPRMRMGNFVRSIISFIVFQCKEDSREGPRDPRPGRASGAGSSKAGQGNEAFECLDNQPARTGLQRRGRARARHPKPEAARPEILSSSFFQGPFLEDCQPARLSPRRTRWPHRSRQREPDTPKAPGFGGLIKAHNIRFKAQAWTIQRQSTCQDQEAALGRKRKRAEKAGNIITRAWSRTFIRVAWRSFETGARHPWSPRTPARPRLQSWA